MNNDDLPTAGESETAAEAPRRGRPPLRAADARSEPRTEAPRLTRQRSNAEDKFAIPAHMIPDGMTYEWKRYSTYGQEDHFYMQAQKENHWAPVDTSRHAHLMPPGHKGPIIRDGLILMERPSYLTQEARDEDRMMARQQVRSQEQKLQETPDNTFTRDHVTARPRVGRSYEAMPIPND